jgi:hypothetical protein
VDTRGSFQQERHTVIPLSIHRRRAEHSLACRAALKSDHASTSTPSKVGPSTDGPSIGSPSTGVPTRRACRTRERSTSFRRVASRRGRPRPCARRVRCDASASSTPCNGSTCVVCGVASASVSAVSSAGVDLALVDLHEPEAPREPVRTSLTIERSSAEGPSIPEIRTVLSRDRSPRTSVTADRRTPNSRARKRCNSTFALPSTAGAARRRRNRVAVASASSERRAPGTTRNLTVMPPGPADHHDPASTRART